MLSKYKIISALLSVLLLCALTLPAQAAKSSQVSAKLDASWDQCYVQAQTCANKCAEPYWDKLERGATTKKDENRVEACVAKCTASYDRCQAPVALIKDALRETKSKKKKKALKKIAKSWEKADDRCEKKYESELTLYTKGTGATGSKYVKFSDSKIFMCYQKAKQKYLPKMEKVFNYVDLPK